jgi:hypothetical protein
MRLFLLALTLIVSFSTFGQRTIMGEVRSKEDNAALPGVNVIEKGTDNTVISDGDGKFTITCKSNKPTLQFSFIALKSVEVSVDTAYLIVYLEVDEEQAKIKTRFGMYPEYTAIGFSAGLNYTPVGISVVNALPMLFGMRALTTTYLTYRTGLNGNDFISVELQKDQLINFRYNARYINLILGYNNRHIAKRNDIWDTQEFTITPELQLDFFLVRVGYGRQSFNNVETLKSNEGFVFGVGNYFKWNGAIIATAKKWNNYWQTEVQLKKGFEKSDAEVGIRFETLARYRELELLLLYRFHY